MENAGPICYSCEQSENPEYCRQSVTCPPDQVPLFTLYNVMVDPRQGVTCLSTNPHVCLSIILRPYILSMVLCFFWNVVRKKVSSCAREIKENGDKKFAFVGRRWRSQTHTLVYVHSHLFGIPCVIYAAPVCYIIQIFHKIVVFSFRFAAYSRCLRPTVKYIFGLGAKTMR